MATITPTKSDDLTGLGRPEVVVTWTGAATGDTITPYQFKPSVLAGPLSSIQIGGTFNMGTTAVLECSNDGVTYFSMKDVGGNTITATAAAFFEFSTTALYVRLGVSSGTADSITAIMAVRG